MKKTTLLIIAVGVIIFFIVAFLITKTIIREITERELKRITQQEINRITKQTTDDLTQSEAGRITNEQIDKLTKEITDQKTREITEQLFGKGSSAGTTRLKKTECDSTQRQYDSAKYYTGPLIDNHIHMPLTFKVPAEIYAEANWDAPILEEEVAVGDIICTFDKENTISSFGFYVVPNLLKDSSVKIIPEIQKQHSGRIVPFLMSAHVSGLNLEPDDIEDVLNSNKGLFKGFGEVAFYKGSFKGVSPDAPSMLEIYKVADKYNLIVMMHPDINQEKAVEKIVKDFPNVIFLFHGDQIENLILNTDFLEKYPNAYFSVDGAFSDIADDHQSVSLYGNKDKEDFAFRFNRDRDRLYAILISKWKGPIEKNPDKFLWGTDRAFAWHFEPEVGALIEEVTRSFIFQLRPDVQEKFAYGNAKRLIES